ncbi:dihydrodipicolinate synthase family protein [Vibrio parahaemolyticus]|uniref:dihydrodipicolinate synthase family protein n=1 Tax=Vibrio parahaemolyticus TaxID=670 RepID=UPI0011203681|nr:dihydrodipicolinate synthase family protein [Vibrio parahaemolyticus]TOG10532.1 hypothetical protein CGJ09_00735 [Vibrio parahaemolyticus]
MFVGLSAFPLTPMYDDSVDEKAFIGLIQRLVNAEVDSIGVLGSTGNYAYLTREERKRVAQISVQHAKEIPVMVGISALNLRDVLLNAEDAQATGASAVLLAPMSYQQLKENEVYNLYEVVTSKLSVPLCVYDNPGTTHFNFTDELHGRIAQFPNVRSIKIPGVPTEPQAALDRVNRLSALIPDYVTIVYVSNLKLPQIPWRFKRFALENSVGFRMSIYPRHALENSITLYVVLKNLRLLDVTIQ